MRQMLKLLDKYVLKMLPQVISSLETNEKLKISAKKVEIMKKKVQSRPKKKKSSLGRIKNKVEEERDIKCMSLKINQ
jgi:hypothetical protein